MRRHKENPSRQFFQINESTGNSMCLLGDCGKVLTNTHAGNLESHIEKHHKIEYAIIVKEKEDIRNLKRKKKEDSGRPIKKIHVSVDRQLLMDACVELVTNNDRPFRLMEDSGFRKIVDPIIAGLNNSFAINSENVREGVLLADQKTRHDIREETKGKMVSIKMDCATRLNRSIYGINLQFIK